MHLAARRIRVPASADAPSRRLLGLPAAIELNPGELRIRFRNAEDLAVHLYEPLPGHGQRLARKQSNKFSARPEDLCQSQRFKSHIGRGLCAGCRRRNQGPSRAMEPAFLGLVVDSSIVIEAERKHHRRTCAWRRTSQYGTISGSQAAKGIKVPGDDLLIGVAALEQGYAVATLNRRHFEKIPNLIVVSF